MMRQTQRIITAITLILLVVMLLFASCVQSPTKTPAPAPSSEPIPPLTSTPTPAGLPESQQAMLGYWEGAYSWAGSKIKIRIHFEAGEEGLGATLDIPGQNIFGLVLSNVNYEHPGVYFELEEYCDAFDGELADGTITGELVRNGISGRFTLERAEVGAEEMARYPWPATPYWLAQSTPKPVVTETIVQEGDLILSGDEVREFSNVRLILKGNLVVKGRASFKATNVILEQSRVYNKQYGIQVLDDATFELQNVFIDSGGPWMNIDFMGSSRNSLTRVWGTDNNIPWYVIEDNAQVSIKQSVVGMTPSGELTSNISIQQSNVMIELTVPETGWVDTRLPFGYTPVWHFPSSEDSGIPYNIQVEDSWLRTGGMAISPGAHVTLRDTESVVVLFGVGWNWNGAVVELRDLKPGFLEDRTWEVDGAVLRVVNTYITAWYPNAGGDAELTLLDSEVNEFEPWGKARVIIRNSRLSVIHATSEVEMWVYDSSVDFDVIAYDEAVIHLFNTTVGGQLHQVDEGKIYVDDEP